MKVKIFPPKFVNLLRPQTREGADRQDWKVFWRCHGEKSAELFNRESRHMVADHRRFINKLNHVCGRVAPAEGKRPHRAQNGTKIILRLWSNFKRLNPVIDIGTRNLCNNAISHYAPKSRQPRLKIADVNLAFALRATVRDELICHFVDTRAASS